MVEFVGYDGIEFIEEWFEDSAICIEACGIEYGVVSSTEVCYGLFEFFVNVLCAADKSDA